MVEDLFTWRDRQEAKRSTELAQARRDTGIAHASRGAGETWRAYAIAFLEDYLKTHTTLFVDDLWRAGLNEPASPRALGAVVQHASRSGWCVQVKTPEGFVAARPSVRSNMQLKPVWKSRLYVGPTA